MAANPHTAHHRAVNLVRHMRADNGEAIISLLADACATSKETVATILALMELVDNALVHHCPDPDAWLDLTVRELALSGSDIDADKVGKR